jgi:hypothetical protein
MSRGHVEYMTLGPAQDTWYIDGVATGARRVRLSADSETGAESMFLRIPPRWHWPHTGSFEAEVELLVLRGELRWGATALKAGDYAVYAPGAAIPTLDSEAGCELVWMSAGPSKWRTHSHPGPLWSVHPVHIPALPWLPPPSFEGRTAEETGPGLGVKFLRENKVTGAYTLLTRHDPMWSDPRLESHDTWEELLLLEGEFLMGNTGVVTAGTYIFRPGLRPHGPQATGPGATWFCRGERRIDFKFESPDWAAERSRRYLASGADTHPLVQPWGPIT